MFVQILISMKGVRIVAPRVDDPTVLVPLQLQMKEVVKVLIHSGKGMPVLFLYTVQWCASYVRKALNMADTDGIYSLLYYFFYSPSCCGVRDLWL